MHHTWTISSIFICTSIFGHEPIRAVGRGRSSDTPGNSFWGAFMTRGRLRMNQNPSLTHAGRQMAPLFSTSSAGTLLSDKKTFTAERWTVMAELPMTIFCWKPSGGISIIQWNLITQRVDFLVYSFSLYFNFPIFIYYNIETQSSECSLVQVCLKWNELVVQTFNNLDMCFPENI